MRVASRGFWVDPFAKEEPENKTDKVVGVGKPIGEKLAEMGRDNRPIIRSRCGAKDISREPKTYRVVVVCDILDGLIQEELTNLDVAANLESCVEKLQASRYRHYPLTILG